MPTAAPADPPPAAVLPALAAATDRLLNSVDGMTARAFAEASLVPGWSRAHVLAHLALGAKALAAVLTTLGQDHPLPMYASDRRRGQDIDRLARQSPARIADLVAVSASILAGHLGGGPHPEDALELVGAAGQAADEVARAQAWHGERTGASVGASPRGPANPHAFARAARHAAAEISAWSAAGTFERTPGGQVLDANRIPLMRWHEVEIHHADLGLTYGPDDWPTEFADVLGSAAGRPTASRPTASCC